MGNHQTGCGQNLKPFKSFGTLKSKKSKFIKSKNQKTDVTYDSDEFIINHMQNNKIRINDIKLFDPRRIIFVSLIGLYNTWKSCPPIALYSSICIIPLKRAWIFSPKHYIKEIQSHFISKLTIFADIAETEQFIQFIKWKDKQGLVFWMKNEYECDKKDSLIHPFWINLNSRLTNLYDPITRKKYNSINLDRKQWRNETKYMSKYGPTKTTQILSELFFLTMRYKNITTILNESNPKSFLIIKSYTKESFIDNKIFDDNIYNEFDNKEENIDDWWVSPDYDPYDLDQNVHTEL